VSTSGSTPVRAANSNLQLLLGAGTWPIFFTVFHWDELLMRFPGLAVLLALCCGLANGCSRGISRATAATVLSVKGTVVFGSAEQTNFQPVTLKSRIHDGNTVRIPDGASIDIALIPAALAQMSGNSEIKIEELRIAKDANQTDGGMRDRSARIRLSQGKITILFNRSDRSASQFVIKTRQVTISADSDCLFRVQTDDTTARVTCERGKIYASAGTQPQVTITAGYFRQWPSAHPEPLPAADDATAQIDITESLEIGEQLRKLQSSRQSGRPL
jgi:hypothetical protein